MDEASRTEALAVNGAEPELKQRRPWDTPVLREILIGDGTDGKTITDISEVRAATHVGPS